MLTTSVSLRMVVEEGMASLIIEEHGDIGTARDIALLSLVVGMWQIGKMLTGREFDAGPADYAELAIPEPAYFGRFKHLVPGMRFGQPVSRVVFDAKVARVAAGARGPRGAEVGERPVRACARCPRLRGRLHAPRSPRDLR